jgi:hypothetical protein
MDRDTLTREYRRISDEELISMVTSGKLTQLAQGVAADELRRRGTDPARLPRPAEDPEPEPESSTSDFVTVYRTLSLSEAQLLRARLKVEGIPPYVADEHTVQTDQLLAPAMGGFRVRVPREMAGEARQLLSEIQAGNLALDDGEQAATNAVPTPAAPLWNPDLAAALSIVFTPIFGAVIHALNWTALGDERRARAAWTWAACISAAAIAASLYGIFAMQGQKHSGAFLRLVLLVSLVFWYFGAARAQSKLVVKDLKGAYVRASWFTPVWLAAIVCSIAFAVMPIWR